MKSKPFGALFGLLALVAILGVAPAFGQTANEIDMATGAGGSANAACVATNDCFTPNPLTVAPGTTVTWKNTDTVSHYVTSGKASDETTGTVFDSGNLIKPGGSYQFTFADAGTYDYFCSVHPWMTGQVIVAAAAATSTQSDSSMQAGSMNMTQPSSPVQTGSMDVTTSQSSDTGMQTGSMNMTASQPSDTPANTGSSSATENQPNNGPTETNNAQPTTQTTTQQAIQPVASTTPAPSDAQTSAWIVGIVVVAIMSGVGIWSTARRK